MPGGQVVCPKCGKETDEAYARCQHCSHRWERAVHPRPARPGQRVNQSGASHASSVREITNRWNWGAFFLGSIWALGNRLWLVIGVALVCWTMLSALWALLDALLAHSPDAQMPLLPAFIVGASVVWRVVLGLRGSRWAWRYRRFDSIEEFRDTQRVWAAWGLGLFALHALSILARYAGMAGSQ